MTLSGSGIFRDVHKREVGVLLSTNISSGTDDAVFRDVLSITGDGLMTDFVMTCTLSELAVRTRLLISEL